MSRIFLSYVRQDVGRAEAVAKALEQAGHSVWWDRHIKGGAQFSKEIEEALNRAEAVVVLWSANSVDSAWVRDEAAAGRDSGRLVPARLDQVEPPLGFRQYQTIDLSGRAGRNGAKAMARLVEAVEAVAGEGSEPAKPAAKPRSWAVPRWAMAAVLLAVLAAVALVALKPWDRAGSVPVVAVQSADPTAASKGLARDLMIKLGSLQKARADYLHLTEDAKGADLVLEATAAKSGSQDEASLALFAGADRNLLWSQQFTGSADIGAGLRDQAALTAARVLVCALQALTDAKAKLGPEVIKLYLNGCAAFDELAYGEMRQIIPVMREVTKRAPKFDGGWGKLLQAEILASINAVGDSATTESLRRDILQARRANPHLAEAYLAEVELLPADAYGQRMSRLDLAIRHNPNHADTYAARAHYLRIVGLHDESLRSSQRAIELNPLSPALHYDYVIALSHARQIDEARRQLDIAEKRWPGSSVISDARYRFNLRYGDPREADRSQQRGATRWTARLTEEFLKARIDPTPAKVNAAIREAEAAARQDPRGLGVLVQVLGTFDQEGKIFELLRGRPSRQLAEELGEALFRPYMRELWNDPRSMLIAKQLKLTDYWRQSGKWPDFCFEPDLPYDCKAEAAKLGS